MQNFYLQSLNSLPLQLPRQHIFRGIKAEAMKNVQLCIPATRTSRCTLKLGNLDGEFACGSLRKTFELQ